MSISDTCRNALITAIINTKSGRLDKNPHTGYRNGYERATIRTAESKIPVFAPQVRQSITPFNSRLLGFLRGNTDVLEGLVAEMYARGLSTRDIEDAFTDATGECLLSKSAVSEVTEVLWEEYEAFAKRDLSDLNVCYLFLDVIYESLRRHGTTKEGIFPVFRTPHFCA